MALKKAKRQGTWLKILLDGASGSGKTYSALAIASGISKNDDGEGIAVIDTENGRASYYADKFDFSVIDDMGAGRREDDKYSPESYIDAIKECIDAGYRVIVIDGLSNEWKYLNDMHSKVPGNSYTNWAPFKERHGKLFQFILECPAHIIATARSKTSYVIEENDKGKKTISKKGLDPIQDSQIEYEYTCTFNLEQDTHIATASKDNTGLFDGVYKIIDEKDGVALWNWANSGEIPVTKRVSVNEASVPTEPEISSVKRDIMSLATSLVKEHKDEVMQIMKKYTPTGNPNKLTDLGQAKSLLEDLQQIQ